MDSFLGRFLAPLSVSGGISNTSAQYLRIAALTMAAYDWLLTLPAEWRFYRTQANILRPSLACVLFFLMRYVSITVIIFSNVGNFATFSEAGCKRFYMGVPVTKTFQTIISQAILSVRTYALSKRSKPVAILLAVMFVTFGFALAFVNIYARIPSMPNGHCTSGNSPGNTVAWLHFVFAMTYDLVTLVISSYYLLGRSPIAYFSFSRIARMIVFDGLGFFFLLTAVNILNLILFKTSPTALQAAGSPLAQAVTWIMSQRILIHLREIGDDTSRGRTPKEAPNFGMGAEGGSSHEMGIRITIRREVQHDDGEHAGTPTTKSATLGSGDKNREAFGDV